MTASTSRHGEEKLIRVRSTDLMAGKHVRRKTKVQTEEHYRLVHMQADACHELNSCKPLQLHSQLVGPAGRTNPSAPARDRLLVASAQKLTTVTPPARVGPDSAGLTQPPHQANTPSSALPRLCKNAPHSTLLPSRQPIQQPNVLRGALSAQGQASKPSRHGSL
jgi:hypothetical protein